MVTLANETIVLSDESLDDLRGSTQGDVIAPGESGYDQFRMGWNLTVQQHPAVILVDLHFSWPVCFSLLGIKVLDEFLAQFSAI